MLVGRVRSLLPAELCLGEVEDPLAAEVLWWLDDFDGLCGSAVPLGDGGVE